MAYDDERPDDWSTFDRVATATDDLATMLQMHDVVEPLKAILGPENYKRLYEYVDCIEKNLDEMGERALRWAQIAIEQDLQGSTGGAAASESLDALRGIEEQLENKHRAVCPINKAWNIAEKWDKNR